MPTTAQATNEAPVGLGAPSYLPALPAGVTRTPEHIVLAIEPGDRGSSALEWTADRAARSSALVDVITVLKPDPVLGGVVVEELMLLGENTLHNAADVLRARVDESSFRTLLSSGSPIHEILDAAEDADLLVVGTDNATRNPIFHHPSVASRLTTVGRTDLAVVPAGWRADQAERLVVVGVSGEADDRVTIARAAREAEQLGAALELAHAWSRPSFAATYGIEIAGDVADYEAAHQQMLDTALAEAREHYPALEITGRIADLPVARLLHETAEHASLLVVGSHRSSAFDRFFVGSTSHDAVAYPACPTLVVRSRARRAVEVHGPSDHG